MKRQKKECRLRGPTTILASSTTTSQLRTLRCHNLAIKLQVMLSVRVCAWRRYTCSRLPQAFLRSHVQPQLLFPAWFGASGSSLRCRLGIG